MLPDQPAINKAFDYLVPEALGDQVRVGAQVRIALHGRRVGGWVVADGVEPPEGVTLRPVAKVTGWGPSADVIDLARWAAWRWAGRPAQFLRTASPETAVRALPRPAPAGPPVHTADDELVAEAFRRRADGVAPASGGRRLRRGPGRGGAGPRADPGAVGQRGPSPGAAPAARRAHGGDPAPGLGPGPGRGGGGGQPGRGLGAGGGPGRGGGASTSTTSPGNRSRRPPGTPATSPRSGPGEPGCRACWCRPCRRSRPSPGVGWWRRRGPPSVTAGPWSTWSTGATTTPRAAGCSPSGW